LILPVFYARKDVITPVKAAFVSMLVNIALGAFFTFYTGMEQRGLALAATIAAFVNYAILSNYLKHDPARPLEGARLTETLIKCSFAGLLAVGGPWLLYRTIAANWPHDGSTLGRALLLLPMIVLSIPLYFALAHAFRVPDADRAYDMVKRRFLRLRNKA
jgi:peptidoglycan biosynthesis protein MviN/MurJ (putative lipid II flippase)